MKIKALLMLALLAPLLLMLACGQEKNSGNEAGKQSVSIALDWVPNTNHTGVYVAQQQGWYAAEGLNVTILPYSEGSAPDVQVAAGRANFGFSFAEAVTMARAADRPVVSLAAVIQKNTSALVTLKSSGLDKLSKLEGKRYAGFGAPYEEPVIQTAIRCDGGSTGKFENVTTNTFGFEALQAKQADFVWIFMGWEGIAAKRQNIDLNVFPPTASCIPNYYTPVVITNEKMLKNRPDVVRRFMRATAKGYEYAISNPNDAATLLIRAAPQGSFPDQELVKQSAAFLAPKYKEGKSRWGEQDLAAWTDYPRFMLQNGALKNADGKPVTKDLNYAAFFTNEYLP